MKNQTQENNFQLELPPLFDLQDLPNSFFSNDKEFQNEGEKLIVFLLGETQYAFPVDSVNEVIRHLKLTNLYNVPEWLLGIANLRGDIISVIDLQKLWEKQSLPYTAKSKLIVIHCEESNSKIAFKVDKICEIVTLSSNEIQHLNSDDSPFLIGQTKYKSGTINLLDIESTLCSLKLN